MRLWALIIICNLAAWPLGYFSLYPKSGRLVGKQNPNKAVALTAQTFLDGSWQAYFGRRAIRANGLFPSLFRVDNEVNYRLTGEVSANYSSTVVSGLGGWLFEREYLTWARNFDEERAVKLQLLAEQLAQAQKSLQEKSVDFLVVISPNKAALYPEKLSARYVPKSRKRTQYQTLIEALKVQNVNFFDSQEYLEARKMIEVAKSFSPWGSHWNSWGGCLALSQVFSALEKHSAKQYSQIKCANPTPSARSKGKSGDAELMRLANLMTKVSAGSKAPDYSRKVVRQVPRKLLIVGTSFEWEILRQIKATKTATGKFYYYGRREYTFPRGADKDGGPNSPLPSGGQMDAVIIELNMTNPASESWPILEKLASSWLPNA